MPLPASNSSGVMTKKLSRLTSVTSTLSSARSVRSRFFAVYSPPNPPPRMRMCRRADAAIALCHVMHIQHDFSQRSLSQSLEGVEQLLEREDAIDDRPNAGVLEQLQTSPPTRPALAAACSRRRGRL